MPGGRTGPIEGIWHNGTHYELYFDDPGEGDEIDLLVTVLDPYSGDRRQSMGAVVYRQHAAEYIERHHNDQIDATLHMLLS
jgi:hypothetical protein